MKLLRTILLAGGLFLIGWGAYSWITASGEQNLSKIVLGVLVLLASSFARSRRG